MSWEGWLQANLFCKAKCNAGNLWCSTFVFICWLIWKWRNNHIFESHFRKPNYPGMVISAAISEWNNAQLKSDLNRTYCLKLLNWMKPPHGTYKLNIDGSRNGHSGKIGAGGVIRCSNGLWIKGFQINLGIGEVLDAESWGLYYGLQQALKCHITHVEVETDSAILAKLISHTDVTLHPMGSLICCCKNLIRNFLCFSLKHIYRESNMVADCLAKESINHDYGIIEFDSPPTHASSAYLDDLDGATRQRRISVRHDDRPS
ncbi:putative ribonuclease H-like domain-containing protein [Rosa chinensis]|uniref:Putative ribonuclease H-like domain-containing protein n=1 Tax=Rosa chinensis TaxID=74649 RepID=A0A2P6P7T7_ROSCH|nr:putative ribonuclease H-like domain-containing protein [Rosa chinensis]